MARRGTATATHNALKVVFTTIFPFIKFIHDENCFRHKTTRQLFSYFGILVMTMTMTEKKLLHKSANKTISFAYFCTKLFNVKLNERTMNVRESQIAGWKPTNRSHLTYLNSRIYPHFHLHNETFPNSMCAPYIRLRWRDFSLLLSYFIS